MKKVYAICGLKGSGKTTACRTIMEELQNAEIQSFASPIKDACRTLFSLSDEQLYGSLKEEIDERWGCTPRHIMQFVGTEMGRGINENIWIINMNERIKNSQKEVILIDDCRFLNESEYLKSIGAKILGIKRAECSPDNHQSEIELDKNMERMCHDIVLNDSDIRSFKNKVAQWVKKNY